MFAGTPDWAGQSEEQENQILICQFSSHLGRWFPAMSHQTHRKKKKGGQQEPDHLCQMVFLHCRLTTVHTSSLHTHAHARTDTQTHRLCAVRSNVLPYNPGYSINKLRECEIDYFFSLTVSHHAFCIMASRGRIL